MSVDEMISELEMQATYGDACIKDCRAIIAALRRLKKLEAVASATKKLRTPIDENYSVNDRMQAIVEVDRALAVLEEGVSARNTSL